jgi:carbon-monoxide dehydrogenase medium subunit
MPLEDFYTGRGEQVNLLRPGQVLTRIQLPAPLPHSGGVHLKHSLREAIDFAVVGIAVAITVDPGAGVCRDARILLGSVATGPMKPVETEALLQGRTIDEELAGTVARLASKEAHPITHLGVSAHYKRKMIEALTKRAVRQAWQQAVAG